MKRGIFGLPASAGSIPRRVVCILAMTLMLGMATESFAQNSPMTMTIATGVDPGLSQFYVVKTGKFLEKNGINAEVKVGSSGSAMVPLLIGNQVQAVLAAEQAGIQNFNLDPNVVIAAEMVQLRRWYHLIGRNVDTLDGLKGKRVGVARGSGSEVFWVSLVDALKLNPADYTIVNVEPPEMVAALERGNIDAATLWEPWTGRAIEAVPGIKLLRDNDGITVPRVFVYVNRDWAEKNPATMRAFLRSLVEATEFINKNRPEAAKQVAEFIKLDRVLTERFMSGVDFGVQLQDETLEYLKGFAEKLRTGGKLAKAVDWDKFIYSAPLAAAFPDRVKLTNK